jgi:large subunit ribosomal protein L4
MRVERSTAAGAPAGTVELPDQVFGVVPNRHVLHQVVTAQRAAARSGTHSTKNRATVSGGGAKPWRQKGTGRARHGSIRAPQWRGGAIAHGPRPRDYRQRTPKKMVRLALCSALSDRAAAGRIKVVDEWGIGEPRTKRALEILEALGLRPAGERPPRVLLVLDRSDEATWKSFRNLGERVQIVLPEELNAYDVLVNDWLVFSQPTLEAVVARLGAVEPPAGTSGEAHPEATDHRAAGAADTPHAPGAAGAHSDEGSGDGTGDGSGDGGGEP